MAVKEISYSVSAAGIAPANEQAGGTQSEHRATKLIFNLTDELREKVTEQAESGKAVCRFDAYDGEGNVVRGAPQELGADTVPEFYLEEWLTRAGGRIRVYLVITVIVNESTEMELYSFPALLRLNNLPDAEVGEGESYESVATVAQSAKDIAQSLRDDADAGKFKGDKGDTGPQGEQGEAFTYEDFTAEQLAGLKGERGVSGVYVGSGDMPEGYNVQIDPDGETVDMNTLATKQYVDEEIATFDFIKVVDALPDTGLPNKIYLAPRDEADGNNLFDEYIWANSAWEFITTKVVEVDLTNYPTKAELTEQLDPIKQDIAVLGVDYITERGETEVDGVTWTWEKWNSGKAVCWGRKDIVDVLVGVEASNGLYMIGVKGADFPFTFTDIPMLQVSYTAKDSYSVWVASGSSTANLSISNTGYYHLARAGSATVNGALNFCAMGKWK